MADLTPFPKHNELFDWGRNDDHFGLRCDFRDMQAVVLVLIPPIMEPEYYTRRFEVRRGDVVVAEGHTIGTDRACQMAEQVMLKEALLGRNQVS